LVVRGCSRAAATPPGKRPPGDVARCHVYVHDSTAAQAIMGAGDRRVGRGKPGSRHQEPAGARGLDRQRGRRQPGCPRFLSMRSRVAGRQEDCAVFRSRPARLARWEAAVSRTETTARAAPVTLVRR
jgi:hypothetical protein